MFQATPTRTGSGLRLGTGSGLASPNPNPDPDPNQQVGEKTGAAFSLDGGGDGQSEDVAAAKEKRASLSRRSTSDANPLVELNN